MERHPIFSFAGQLPDSADIQTILDEDIYIRTDIKLGGDAPKQVAHIFETGQRTDPTLWPLYVVKTPQYRYPIEVIYEHLLARIGRVIGINTADTQLVCIGGQIRLLSAYFLLRDEYFFDGADVYAPTFGSRKAALQIEIDKQARQTFTVQQTCQGLASEFGEGAADLSAAFVRMLLFDALVGHSDRNLTNWGVIVGVGSTPTFAPVFDTVRALMLNISDDRLGEIRGNSRAERQFWESQIGSTLPKIGWAGVANLSYTVLAKQLLESPFRPDENWLHSFFSPETEASVADVLQKEFAPLLSDIRLWAIKTCLQKRWQALRKVIKKTY